MITSVGKNIILFPFILIVYCLKRVRFKKGAYNSLTQNYVTYIYLIKASFSRLLGKEFPNGARM